jgi:hypothetical protein
MLRRIKPMSPEGTLELVYMVDLDLNVGRPLA